MPLENAIANYYFDNLQKIPIDKQFHFATRLAAWNGDRRAFKILESQRQILVPQPTTELSLRQSLDAVIKNPPQAQINALSLRQPYFKKYPELRGFDFALFRVRHLEAIYGVDARHALFKTVSPATLRNLQKSLEKDDSAICFLSTYAINYIYLLEKVIFKTENISVDYFYRLGKTLKISSPLELQLLIYLYTHCIIGDTNFYIKRLPRERIDLYRQMLATLEPIIQKSFSQISLDNKLEFLVCCRICNFHTTLSDRIADECSRSLSPNGHFLVDTHNSYAATHYKITLADSEHRNVLFIMSCSPYTPHNTVLSD